MTAPQTTVDPTTTLTGVLESFGLGVTRRADGTLVASATDRDEWGNVDALCAYHVTPAPLSALTSPANSVPSSETAWLADALEESGLRVASDQQGTLIAGSDDDAFYVESVV